MSATFSRRRAHALAALAFTALAALTAHTTVAHAAPLALASHATPIASVPLLDELERSVRAEGGAMRDLNLQGIADIRQQLKDGKPVPAWALAGLVSKLTAECEHEVVRQPERALRKIALTLRLIDAWQDRSENWLPHLRMDQGKVLLLRWFLRGDTADRDRAHRLYAAIDEAEIQAKDRGRAAYHLGAEYEELAGHASDLGRSREEQVALILAGIAVNRAGHAKYPDYDSLGGLNALYGKLQFVSGGSAQADHLDAWIADMNRRSPTAQGRSADALADALFTQGRDEEALAWMRHYAGYWARVTANASASSAASVEAGLRGLRCGMLDLDTGFLTFARRQPRQGDEIRAAICEGKPLPLAPPAPAPSTPTVSATDAALLDELERSVRVEGGFMKELTEEGIADVRRKLAAGETPSGVDYGMLISKLVEECQDEAVAHPDRALRKIALALKLADAWRDRFETWDSIVRRNEATALMWRWLLLGNDGDRQLAHRLHALNDETETIPKDRGMGAYFLGAEYEQLAMAAQKLGRPRDVQVALLRQGLAVHQAGHARYRDGFDSTVGLNALYRTFEFVSGGSMLPVVMDEWLAVLRDRSPQAQARSGISVAGPLLQLRRDQEAVAWLQRYLVQDESEDAAQLAILATRPDVPPSAASQALAMRREGRCMTILHKDEFQQLSQREPRLAASVVDRACADVSPEDSPNLAYAMARLRRPD